jgi:hypothetical protein
MKTIKLFALSALMIVTSCSKEADWECKCDIDGKENMLVIFDETKKDARAECKDAVANTNYTITNCRLAGKNND